jgi:DNA-binding NarL/FixJ family response regulator
MNKRTADTWAWIVWRVTGEAPQVTEVRRQAPHVTNMPHTPLPSDYRVDISGLTTEQQQEATRLLREGHSKEEVAAALTQMGRQV